MAANSAQTLLFPGEPFCPPWSWTGCFLSPAAAPACAAGIQPWAVLLLCCCHTLRGHSLLSWTIPRSSPGKTSSLFPSEVPSSPVSLKDHKCNWKQQGRCSPNNVPCGLHQLFAAISHQHWRCLGCLACFNVCDPACGSEHYSPRKNKRNPMQNNLMPYPLEDIQLHSTGTSLFPMESFEHLGFREQNHLVSKSLVHPSQESLLEAEAPLERVGFYMQTCFFTELPRDCGQIVFC